MAETYVRWTKAQNCIGPFARREFRRDSSGLRILLEEIGTPRLLELCFRKVVFFRSADEGYRTATWLAHAGMPMLGLFIVNDSRLVALAVEEAAGTIEAEEILHFAIHTQDDCMDVLSKEEPTLVILED